MQRHRQARRPALRMLLALNTKILYVCENARAPAAGTPYHLVMLRRWMLLAAICAAVAHAAPKRLLYVTATYGFRHVDAIPVSIAVFNQLAQESGAFEVGNTEDLSLINAAYLANFDAVFFYATGALEISAHPQPDPLPFARPGGGSGSSH